MKNILIVLVVIPQILLSQVNPGIVKTTADLGSEVYEIMPSLPAPDGLRFPFSKIEILDSRFDTSKLGFTFNRKSRNLDHKDFKKIKLTGGIANSIQQFYNDRYKLCFNKSDDHLLIVLKKLWIDNLPFTHTGITEYDLEHQSYQDIYIKFECYLHRGNDYYPLIRVDTLYRLADENIKTEEAAFKKNDLSFFNHTIEALIEKLNFDDLFAKVPAQRKLSIDDIHAFNEKRFSLPILTTAKYHEGVYLDTKEFISNSPSVKEYKINKKGMLSKIGDKKLIETVYWGFADSSGLHISSAKNIEIFRIGNSFEFFREETFELSRAITGLFLDSFFSVPTPGPLNGFKTFGPSGQTRSRTIISPRQIDMETGEVY